MTAVPAPNRMLAGHRVFRVVSRLNTDLLVGYCWCGAEHHAQDPIELWEWLLAHPSTHPGADPGTAAPTPTEQLAPA